MYKDFSVSKGVSKYANLPAMQSPMNFLGLYVRAWLIHGNLRKKKLRHPPFPQQRKFRTCVSISIISLKPEVYAVYDN